MLRGVSISHQNGKRIVKGLGYYRTGKIRDLREIVKSSSKEYGDAVGFKFKNRDNKIVTKTYREFNEDIDILGTALISLGLKDSHIAIISENRYEWAVSYYAIVNGTGVVVPLDRNLPQNEVQNLIDRGKIQGIFYSIDFHSMMTEIAKVNNEIKYFICMDSCELTGLTDKRFVTMSTLIDKGRALLQSGDKSFVDAPIDRNKMSMLLFTSGTTNTSKGVMLSHANIASNVEGVAASVHAGRGDVHLSLLPLHHTYENTLGMTYMIYRGVCIAYCQGLKHVAQNMKEFGVTILIAVPAIFEAIYKKLNEGIKKSGKEKLVKTLIKVSETLRALKIDLRRKLFKSIFNQIGPKLRLGICGAAPLNPEIIKGFDKFGLKILEGYGLTETSPLVAGNNDFVNKPGTVGYPIAGVEIAIDNPDENGAGEIITRGENVMLGYYENPEATAEVIDKDGWFRTGDVGIIDKNGMLKITGRVKSMIVLSNGKKAFPEEYEELLKNLPAVKDSFVWGNQCPNGEVQVCAKLVIDKEKLKQEKGYIPSEEELALHYDAAIREINKTIPQYKIIRYFVITFEDLVKTTTLKIKRSVEYEKIKAVLEKAGLEMRKASGRVIDTLNWHQEASRFYKRELN